MVDIKNVRIPVEGGTLRAALAMPDVDGANPKGAPGLLVLHELGGLNDDIRAIAARFAANGYAALAPDLYSVGPPKPICIMRTMRALNGGRGRVFDDLRAAQQQLAACDGVDPSRQGVVGFCMGGSFAILHAVREPLSAAGAFYARVPHDANELSGICPLVAGYGGRDRLFAAQAPRLRGHLERLGVPHNVETYPRAGHSYMNQRSEPALIRAVMRRSRMAVAYDHDSAEDSWQRMLAFFAEHLAT